MLAVLVVCHTACDPQVDGGLSTSTPLIDLETFFGDPHITGASLSPDGRWVSFRRPYRGVMNIWVKGIGEPFSAARPITADTERGI